ncbi:MAG: hypothetical protein RQ751_13350, partial [Longimicrobiales bacterium]|nr:hypothetical protein [Longimicrobiales bacterium]
AVSTVRTPLMSSMKTLVRVSLIIESVLVMISWVRLESSTPEAAARAFAAEEGVNAGSARPLLIDDLEAVALPFSARSQSGDLAGEMTWIRYGSNTFQFMALSTPRGWDGAANTLREAVRSFARERDEAILATSPMRVAVQRLDRPTPLATFLNRHPSEVPEAIVGVINQVDPGGVLPAGPAKQVVRRP